MSYKQLTREQRYQIYVLLKAAHKQTQIASIIGCHKSTICRELRRNRGRKGYRPNKAHTLAKARQGQSHQPQISSTTWQTVEQLLRQEWSPEQIANSLRQLCQPTVSHERIYRYVYNDQRQGGTLYQHLRRQKRRRKRYRGPARRAQFPKGLSIEQRPPIVASKARLGDWEIDTLIGAHHQGALLSCTERKSKLVLLCQLATKSARELRAACIELLGPFAPVVHTITVDNGKEFCEYKAIAAALQTDIYFAHPYASWERGLNENTNGLIRQYFPKKHDFTAITQAEVEFVMQRLNNRPRKTLGYRTPNEVFFKELPLHFRSEFTYII